MIKNLFMALVMLSISNCKSQENKQQISTQKKDTMEYFDKTKYDKLPIDPKVNYKVLPNGDHVIINIHKSEIILDVLKQNTPIKDYFVYYENKIIKATGHLFYSFPYGNQLEYDETGKLIKEKDYEKDYKFSIEDVCELIKKEYGIDLMVKSNPNTDKISYSCNRYKKEVYKNDFQPVYIVEIYITMEGGAGKRITIDGITGKILYDIPCYTGYGYEQLPKSKTTIVTPEGVIKK